MTPTSESDEPQQQTTHKTLQARSNNNNNNSKAARGAMGPCKQGEVSNNTNFRRLPLLPCRSPPLSTLFPGPMPFLPLPYPQLWCTLFLPLLACARLCLVPLYIFVPSQTPMRQRPLPSKSRRNNLQPGARGTPPLPAAARRPPLPLTARLSYQQSDSKTQGRRPVLPDQSGFLPDKARKKRAPWTLFLFSPGEAV